MSIHGLFKAAAPIRGGTGIVLSQTQGYLGRLLAGTALTVVLINGPAWAQTGLNAVTTPPADVTPETDIDQNRTYSFSIAAQPLIGAMSTFSQITGLDLVLDGAMPKDLRSPGFTGTASAPEALSQLLTGTGFGYRLAGGRAIAILPKPQNQSGEDSTTLEKVTVLGRREQNKGFNGAPDALYRTPSSATTVTRAQIERQAPRNTSDIFNSVAGVWTATDRQNPGIAADIRGQHDSGRVNVTIDGARQNYFEGGHGITNRAYIDTGLIAAVDVEKTASSKAGHSGVTAGSVGFRTLDTEDVVRDGQDYGGQLTAATGTNAYDFSGTAAIGGYINEKVDVTAAFGKKNVGSYEPGSADDQIGVNDTSRLYPSTSIFPASRTPIYASSVQTQPVAQEQVSGLLKINLRPVENHSIKLGYVGYNNEFSTGYTGYADDAYSDLTAHTLTAKHEWDSPNPLLHVTTNLWGSRTTNDEYRPPRSTYGAFDTSYQTETLGADISNRSELQIKGVAIKADYGVEYFKDDAKSSATALGTGDTSWWTGATPSGERDVSSGFGQLGFELGKLQGAVGARYDRYTLDGSGFYLNSASTSTVPFSAENDGGALLPSASVGFTATDNIQLFGGFAMGMRPPTVMESLFHGRHAGNVATAGTYYPNPNLQAEKSRNWEAGVNFSFDDLLLKGDGLRLKTAYFNNTVSDYIALAQVYLPDSTVNNLLSQPQYGYVNLDDDARFNGLEAEGSYDAGWFYLGGSFTLTKSQYSGGYNPNIYGSGPTIPSFFSSIVYLPGQLEKVNWLYSTPERKFTVDAGLRFFDEKLVLGARMNYFGETEGNYGLSTTGSATYSDYELYGLYANYTLTPNVSFNFTADNLTDVAYMDPLGSGEVLGPGRTLILSATLKF